jgi:hypothetical protein
MCKDLMEATDIEFNGFVFSKEYVSYEYRK